MKTFIIDAYRFIYRISGAKMFSVVVAIIYVTILNVIVISGISLLIEGWIPIFGTVHKLFVFPYYFFTGAVLFGLTIWFRPSKKAIAKEAKKTKDYTFILIYTFAALILFVYLRYGDKINFDAKKLNVKPRKRPTYTESALPSLPDGWLVYKKHGDNFAG